MLSPGQNQDDNFDEARPRRRVIKFVIGTIAALVLGLALANLYTYTQYGGTMLDGLFGEEQKKSPAAGKLAYDKGTKVYVGIIRGEGKSPRLGQVYYIEQGSGQMVEIARDKIEVREPGQDK
ncbi:MAG TPA: hypothetical protein VNO70_22410 [Blastocatellia bacterium]|nr:hypothetical protein [Blastocatellia bacterium]